MSREIKFRAWHLRQNRMLDEDELVFWSGCIYINESKKIDGKLRGYSAIPEMTMDLMQYTGLKDKNNLHYVYEGDIIDISGNVIGNIYESSSLLEESTNFVIAGMGTKAWRDTEQEAVSRGCFYAE